MQNNTIKLSQEFLDKYKNQEPFSSLASKLTAYRTYSRFLDSQGRREKWPEIIQRVSEYSMWLDGSNISSSESSKELESMFDSNFNMRWLPAGRTLWSGGTKHSYEVGGLSQFNCSFIAMDSLVKFKEMVLALSLGVGVGFSVEKKHIDKLPEFHKNRIVVEPYKWLGYDALEYKDGKHALVEHKGDKIYLTIPDSKEGWATGVQAVLESMVNHESKTIHVDLNSLRPEGERIKGFGGKSSGPAPYQGLMELLDRMINKKETNAFKLSSVDVLDISNAIAYIIVAGGVRRCLPEHSLVHMKNGLTQIKDVNVGDLVLTNSGYSVVTNKFKQGKQSLVRVNTESGFIDCTANHRIAVIKNVKGEIDWIEASKLEPGMRLMSPARPIDGVETTFPEFVYEKPKHSTTCKYITIPKLDTEIAWLLGLIFGDGYVHLTAKSGAISIACHSTDNPGIANRAKAALERFGVNVTIQKNKDENCLCVRVKSKQLATFLYQFKKPNESLVTPEFIKNGTIEIRSAFLAGLMDSDGAANNRPLSVINSVYPDFIKQIRTLYSSIGIQTKTGKTNRAKDGWQDIYSLNIVGLKARNAYIRLVQPFSVKLVAKKTKPYKSYNFDHNMLDGIDVNTNARVGYCLRNNMMIDLDVYEQFNEGLDFYPVLVESVIDIDGEVQTFDIEVSGPSCFYADGYLVHNSAQICLADAHDNEIEKAKLDYFKSPDTTHRGMSNNSLHFYDKPTLERLLSLADSIKNSWEPGLYNGEAASKRRKNYVGTNPCSEILLNDRGVCNLVTVVISRHMVNMIGKDKLDIQALEKSFREATRHAVRVTNTNIEIPEWDKVQKEDRLIGVSMTGAEDAFDACDTGKFGNSMYDNRIINTTCGEMTVDQFKQLANSWVNSEAIIYSSQMSIPCPILSTTIKPEGTLSLIAGVSAGCHKSFAPYYFRRIRINRFDALAEAAVKMGIKVYPEVGQGPFEFTEAKWDALPDFEKDYWLNNCNTWVLEVPTKSPAKITSQDESALSQLNRYYSYQHYYSDHQTSITITVDEDEWVPLFTKIHDNWDLFIGVSFQKKQNDVYELAPYKPITEDRYEESLKLINKDLDLYDLLVKIEAGEFKADDDLGADCGPGGACPIR